LFFSERPRSPSPQPHLEDDSNPASQDSDDTSDREADLPEETLFNEQVKPSTMSYTTMVTRGRCYDHNFLRFSTIFGEKMGAFLENQCYDQIFA
jgi:hypothetical protein